MDAAAVLAAPALAPLLAQAQRDDHAVEVSASEHRERGRDSNAPKGGARHGRQRYEHDAELLRCTRRGAAPGDAAPTHSRVRACACCATPPPPLCTRSPAHQHRAAQHHHVHNSPSTGCFLATAAANDHPRWATAPGADGNPHPAAAAPHHRASSATPFALAALCGALPHDGPLSARGGGSLAHRAAPLARLGSANAATATTQHPTAAAQQRLDAAELIAALAAQQQQQQQQQDDLDLLSVHEEESSFPLLDDSPTVATATCAFSAALHLATAAVQPARPPDGDGGAAPVDLAPVAVAPCSPGGAPATTPTLPPARRRGGAAHRHHPFAWSRPDPDAEQSPARWRHRPLPDFAPHGGAATPEDFLQRLQRQRDDARAATAAAAAAPAPQPPAARRRPAALDEAALQLSLRRSNGRARQTLDLAYLTSPTQHHHHHEPAAAAAVTAAAAAASASSAPSVASASPSPSSCGSLLASICGSSSQACSGSLAGSSATTTLTGGGVPALPSPSPPLPLATTAATAAPPAGPFAAFAFGGGGAAPAAGEPWEGRPRAHQRGGWPPADLGHIHTLPLPGHADGAAGREWQPARAADADACAAAAEAAGAARVRAAVVAAGGVAPLAGPTSAPPQVRGGPDRTVSAAVLLPAAATPHAFVSAAQLAPTSTAHCDRPSPARRRWPRRTSSVACPPRRRAPARSCAAAPRCRCGSAAP